VDRQQDQPQHAAASDDEAGVADRLQKLTVDEAERVLQRAIQLQSAAPDGSEPELFNTEMLSRIADELDIDSTYLQTALTEELLRLQSEDPDWLDRLLVTENVAARRVVNGDAESVRSVVDFWMTKHEGLRKREENTARTVWEKDESLVTTARVKLRMAHGSGALRTSGPVETAVRPVGDDRQLVTVEANTSNVRRMAVGLLIASAAAGAAAAGATGAADGALGLDNVAIGTVVTGVLSGGIVLGVRMWASRLRSGVKRAVDAVANPQLLSGAESLPRALRRWFGQWRSLGNDVGDEWDGRREP
jgi:hypothetical protein